MCIVERAVGQACRVIRSIFKFKLAAVFLTEMSNFYLKGVVKMRVSGSVDTWLGGVKFQKCL